MSYRNREGVSHVNPDIFVDEKFKSTIRNRRRPRMNPCIPCTLILLVIAGILVGAAFLYQHLKNDHLGCYSPTNERLCFAAQNDSAKYKWFGTKTNYNLAVKWAGNDDKQAFRLPGCKPTLYYQFQRHTTRYPDREVIIENKEILEEIQKEFLHRDKVRLCNRDIVNISHWIYPFVPDQDNLVMPEGAKTVGEQVDRLVKRFPEVFDEHRRFDKDQIIVDFTGRNRSQDTAYAFMSRWFTDTVFQTTIEPKIRNNLNPDVLEFHRKCSGLLKEKNVYVKNVPEVLRLEESSFYKALLETLSSRLGLPVTYKRMKAMFVQCTFEEAILGHSPWCAVFTPHDLKLLEFREDLDDYYKDSFGADRNWKQACVVGRDLFNYVAQVMSPAYGSNHPLTVLHFSHAGAIKKVMAYFGIGKGPRVNWDGLCAERGWRSSQFTPFNANLLFVMWECNDGNFMTTFLNEKLIQLPGCSSEKCPIEEFSKNYDRNDFRCDLQEICS